MDPLEAQERALDEQLRQGRLDKAALIARAMGNPLYAARLFAQTKMPYQAAVCFYEAGDLRASLQNFILLPGGDPRYRRACGHVARIATELGAMSFEVDRFVARFASTDPESAEELATLYKLGVLYQKHELFDHARAVLARVVAADGRHADAAQRLRTLNAVALNAPAVYEAIMSHDASSWRPTRPMHGEPPLSGGPSPRASLPQGRAAAAAPQRLPALARKPPLKPPALPVHALPKAPVPPQPSPEGAVPPASEQTPPVSEEAAPPVSPSSVDVFIPAWNESVATYLPTLRSRDEPESLSEDNAGGPELERGTVIVHRYRIEKEIGRGGMGIVYRATDLELDEQLAIKLFSNPLDDKSMVFRFKQELSLCRQLAHPNIVRLYDIGAHAGRKFITMELLNGTSLKHQLKRGVELRRALSYLLQICMGLGAAHARAIVHRDVKPDNVFVTTEGVVKLMDFGLAKRHGDGENLTVTGFMAGSPGYIAPEQVTDFGAATHAADLYALGVIAYEMLTGKHPFRQKDKRRTIEMQLTTVPPPPSHLAHLPPGTDAIVMRLIDRDPMARFHSAHEVYERLSHLLVHTRSQPP